MPNAEDTIKRYEALASSRATLDSHLDQVRELFYPSALPFQQQDTKGAKVHEKVFDSTPEQAAELLSAGLQSMLTNPATKWFALRTSDDDLDNDEEVSLWLEDTVDRMFAVFNSPRSNFAPNQHELYMDLACFQYIADRPGNLPLFSTRPLAENYLGENEDGRVDTNIRKFKWTARQAFGKWGPAVGEKVAKAAQDAKKQDQEFEFLHDVHPRTDEGKGRRGLPFASLWVSLADKKRIDEGGFHEFPYVCPRWVKRAGEVYGRGPGMKALADARMLQRAMKVTIRGVEKIIDPPLIVADDGVIAPVRVTPSGLNFVRWDMMSGSGSPIRPIETGGRPDLGEDFMASIRNRIETAFYTPLLQFARDPQMTATQVIHITEQVMQTMNPVLGRMQAEDLGPKIDRLFGIMLRGGMLAEPPEAVQGREIRVEYVSPVAKAQRLGEVRALSQHMEIAGGLAAVDPSVYDNLNLDEAFRDAADLLGMSRRLLRDPKLVEQMRQARREAADQQAQMEQAGSMAEAFKTGAQGAQALNQAMSPQTQVAGNA